MTHPAGLKALGQAIASHQGKVRVAFCGFDLWVEVMSSGRVKTRNFKAGGLLAEETEPETTIVIPMMVVGDAIVISFDPTLPPDGFRLGA